MVKRFLSTKFGLICLAGSKKMGFMDGQRSDGSSFAVKKKFFKNSEKPLSV